MGDCLCAKGVPMRLWVLCKILYSHATYQNEGEVKVYNFFPYNKTWMFVCLSVHAFLFFFKYLKTNIFNTALVTNRVSYLLIYLDSLNDLEDFWCRSLCVKCFASMPLAAKYSNYRSFLKWYLCHEFVTYCQC